jgi:hypothetical protein
MIVTAARAARPRGPALLWPTCCRGRGAPRERSDPVSPISSAGSVRRLLQEVFFLYPTCCLAFFVSALQLAVSLAREAAVGKKDEYRD